MQPVGTVSLIRITARSARVDIRAVPGAELAVEGGTTVVHDDGSVDISTRSGRLRVTCPDDAAVVVSTATGAVVATGHVTDLRVISSSGKVEVERAGDLDVRTRSGGVRIGAALGRCRVVTASGTVRVSEADEVSVSSESSSVTVGRAGVAAVRTVSGTIEVGVAAGGRVDATSTSGRVRVRVARPAGATTHLTSRSGRISVDVAEGDGCTITATTSTGSIEVRPA